MAKIGKVDPLYVKSKIREHIKANNLNTSSGVLDGDTLNGLIIDIIDRACERAKGNGRKTVKARDL